MSAEELNGLIADIDQNGQREPATFWNGQLIDGRNRAAACEKLGIELDACELDSETDPVKWVISHNLHRRHLSQSQKATVADRLRDYYDGEAAKRMEDGQKSGGRGKKKNSVEKLPQSKSRDDAGAALGVSGKLVDAARDVRVHGSPELLAKVEAGEVSVTKAAKVAKEYDKPQQVKAIESPPQKPERTVFIRLRSLFCDMTPAERKTAAVMWEEWLGEE
jgi:ParB-like chromosome segregation protein Spo0J